MPLCINVRQQNVRTMCVKGLIVILLTEQLFAGQLFAGLGPECGPTFTQLFAGQLFAGLKFSAAGVPAEGGEGWVREFLVC